VRRAGPAGAADPAHGSAVLGRLSVRRRLPGRRCTPDPATSTVRP
jgi:hypothetical protein